MIDLAVVVLTKDEEANIGRCLEKLRWVPRVLVLDSGSADRAEKKRSRVNVLSEIIKIL